MKITREVQVFAAKQNTSADNFLEADAAMAEMSESSGRKAARSILEPPSSVVLHRRQVAGGSPLLDADYEMSNANVRDG
jgi:hypothetical protein